MIVTLTAGAVPTALKLTPKPGEIFKLKTMVTQTVTQSPPGQPAQQFTQTIGISYSFVIDSIGSDGNPNVTVTYDNLIFKQQGPAGYVDYDSANPPRQTPPAARTFAAMVGQSVKLSITPIGRIVEVRGADVLVERILKTLTAPDGPGRAATERMIRAEFADDALKSDLDNLLAVYPDRVVNIGESWSKKSALTKGMPLAIDDTYTLRDVNPNTVTLELKGRVAISPPAAPVEIGGLKISYKLSGEQTGSVKLDRPSQWIKSVDTNRKISGEMIVEDVTGHLTKNAALDRNQIVDLQTVTTDIPLNHRVW